MRPYVSLWGAPILFVRKEDKMVGKCIDYMYLNRMKVKDRYSLLRIDDLLT